MATVLQEDQQQKSTFNADIIGIYLGIYLIIHQYTAIIIEDQWKINGTWSISRGFTRFTKKTMVIFHSYVNLSGGSNNIGLFVLLSENMW